MSQETIQALREQAKQRADELEKLLSAEGELTPEQAEQAKTLTADLERRSEQIKLREDALKAAARVRRPSEPAPKLAPEPAPKTLAVHTSSEIKLTGVTPPGFDNELDALTSGRWVSGFLLGNRKAREWCLAHSDYYEDEHFTLAQSEGDNSKGGLFVPTQLESAMRRLVVEYGVMLGPNGARKLQVNSDNALVPRPLFGCTWYAVAEVPGADITESDATADSFELPIKNWAGFSRLSEDLDEDATVDIAGELVRNFAYKRSYLVDNVCFNGDGTSTHNGIEGVFAKLQGSSYTASVSTGITGNTAWSTLDAEDFLNVIAKLPPLAGVTPKFYMTRQAFFSSWARLATTAGGTTKADRAASTEFQIEGYPVVFSDVLNKTLNAQVNAYGMLFGDLSLACTIGLRRGMRMKRLDELYALQRQIGIVVSDRWGFVAHDLSGLDGAGSATAGPVIIFRFPAS